MFYNVSGKHGAVQQASLSLAAEGRLRIKSSGCCQTTKKEECIWCLHSVCEHFNNRCSHNEMMAQKLFYFMLSIFYYINGGKEPSAWRTFLYLLELFVDHTFSCLSRIFLSIYKHLCTQFYKIAISNDGWEKTEAATTKNNRLTWLRVEYIQNAYESPEYSP